MAHFNGPRIREIRCALGMTQHQLSMASGVPSVQISELENDRGTQRLETLEALAQALQVSIWDLLEGEP